MVWVNLPLSSVVAKQILPSINQDLFLYLAKDFSWQFEWMSVKTVRQGWEN